MPDNVPSPLFAKRLKANITRGRVARRTLSETLVRLPPEQIARLPRAILARLAPDAITTLSRALARTDDILSDAEPGPPPAESEADAVDRRPLWFVSLLYALLAFEFTALAIEADRPARWSLAQLGMMSGDKLGLCARLDPWTDRCTYQLRGAELSFDDIAVRLSMPADQLAAANPSLPKSGAIPLYASIRIDRSL